MADREMAEHKSRLFSSCTGHVLEIGAGVTHYVGIETNIFMHAKLRAACLAAGFRLSEDLAAMAAVPDAEHHHHHDRRALKHSRASHLCSLVLCSVEEPIETLYRIQALLKPGGSFCFIEHVRMADDMFLQMILGPLLKVVPGGCDHRRPTGEWIKGMDGWKNVEVGVGFPRLYWGRRLRKSK
ncbi:hypothetical protein BC936DRAFT_143204 [Jimgerdemannia flammicorona]|uniref:Methyltransferase type 11 domain-containing protein n=1 Tax=Jimgerdemannia flammicorona TaxID=994334 RepID=A0A433DMB1_9FUNG|nr:hypothetical protein BC936DRAFT_143204 [Jimgerdemannia flammicorona]